MAKPVVAENAEYTAVFTDGKRIKGHLSEWGVQNTPKLNGAPLFDAGNAIRWLRKESGETPAQPAAFIEIFGGDCMPGRLMSVGSSSSLEEGKLLSYLVFEPSVGINWWDGPQRSRIRVASRWLRRIVWERRSSDQYQPATLYYKDGRQLSFRSIRFTTTGVSALTENERRDIRYNELAELDMPRLDWWDAYFEQLALLTPDCKSRLTRLETSDGLRVTTAGDRIQPMPWGDPNNPDFWRHAVQPAWSLDAFWVEHNKVLTRRFYSPHEVPLSLVEASEIKLRSALAVGWRPQIDRNAQGGPLVSGGKDWGWGIGMHAFAEMRFPLPACVRSLHSQVGLDQVAGNGGCARALVYLDKSEGQPLFRSEHLIGSSKTIDTGEVPLNGNGGKAQVVLVAHPAHADRPEGADPFDIRDVVDWLEPQFNLDLTALRGEVRNRLWRLLPSLEGWNVSAAEKDSMIWANQWDNAGDPHRSFHLEMRPQEASLTFSRTLHVEPDQNWLLLYASRNTDGAKATPTQMLVRINGKQAHEAEVQARWSSLSPIVVPLDKYHGQDINVEVRFVSKGDKSFVQWRSMTVLERLPGLNEIFEDAVQPPVQLKWTDIPKANLDAAGDPAKPPVAAKSVEGEKGPITSDRYSGLVCLKTPTGDKQLSLTNLSLPIRENPRFGEYRYLRFAWKKKGGEQVHVDLNFSPGDDEGLTRNRHSGRLKELSISREKLSKGLQELEAVKKTQAGRKLSKKEQSHLDSLKDNIEALRASIDRLDRPQAQATDAATVVYRFFAGNPSPAPAEIRGYRVADKASPQWQVVNRDLFQDFAAPGELTGLSLASPDGDYAELDHVYLARTAQDFERCPQQAPPLLGK